MLDIRVENDELTPKTQNLTPILEYYRLPLYILFGVLPSLVWLFYYLKKDLHPEPKRMILKVFLYGVIITIPVFFIQIGFFEILKQLQSFSLFTSFPIIIDILKWFVVIALVEEVLKYLAVRVMVFNSYELDEPLDIMLYMVVVALGFAALENILYLFSPIDNLSFNTIITTTIAISFIRFIGATFLHTLCSALLGYFLIISFFNLKKRLVLTIIGISLATILHGLYNFSIITLKSPINFIIPTIIIIGLAIFIISKFDKMKNLKSICKI